MCALSVIMSKGISSPPAYFGDSVWKTHFEKDMRLAKEHDKSIGQEDCELDEKRQALKKIADEMGVKIKFP